MHYLMHGLAWFNILILCPFLVVDAALHGAWIWVGAGLVLGVLNCWVVSDEV
jgi:hypothetical protein